MPLVLVIHASQMTPSGEGGPYKKTVRCTYGTTNVSAEIGTDRTGAPKVTSPLALSPGF